MKQNTVNLKNILFISLFLAIYFDINTSDNIEQYITDQSKLEYFLDNENCLTLCASIQEQNNREIQFQNEVITEINLFHGS